MMNLGNRPQIRLIRLIFTDFFSSLQDDNRKISENQSNQSNQSNLWSIASNELKQ